jgi:hypothetical protein
MGVCHKAGSQGPSNGSHNLTSGWSHLSQFRHCVSDMSTVLSGSITNEKINN